MHNSTYNDLTAINNLIATFFKFTNSMRVLNSMPDIVFTDGSSGNPQYRTWYNVSFKNKEARDKFLAMNAHFGLGKLSDNDLDKRLPSANHTFIFRNVSNLEEVVKAVVEVFPFYNSAQSL